MASLLQRGKRLLPATIETIALEEPNRPWISVPQDDNDLKKGFLDITFQQFNNAINHAAKWLDASLGKADSEFETFAYEGPADARLAIITVAAAKVGRKILLPFPFMPAQVKRYLLDRTNCTAFVFAETSRASIQSILDDRPNVLGIAAPSLEDWITENHAEPYKFNQSWDKTADDPWIIFHTSGTTGLPKPVVYTHRMMTTYDMAATFPDANQDTQASYHVNRRVYSTIPMNHLVGMVGALQGSVWLGTTVVLGPASKPMNPMIADQVIQHGRVQGLVAPPILIKGLSLHPSHLQRLKSLTFIQWAGAPLDQATGDILKAHVKLSPAFGTTEAGPYLTLLCEDPDDWAYYSFRSDQGIAFEQRSREFWELVFKKEEDAMWQQIFLLYPDLEEYATKDLFQKHPSREGLWLYAGRADDMVVLSNGHGVHASSIEGIILRDPGVQAAVVSGAGRDRPFLLLQASDEVLGVAKDREDILEAIWPTIETANVGSADFAKIKKNLIILWDPEKPFLRSGKDTLLRRETIALYEEEIGRAYEGFEQ